MTFDWAQYTGGLKWLPDRTIFVTVHGSRCYGTNTPTSDLDVRGVAVAPVEYYLGLSHTFEQAVQHEPVDLTVFELRKFLKLAAQANPNALEILFTDPSNHLLVTPAGEKLLANRELFLSQRCRSTFAGYARAQLKRIEAHRRWLLNPPSGQPTRAEFGLPERTVIPADQLSAAQAAISKQVDTWEWRELEHLEISDRISLKDEFERRLVEITQWTWQEIPDRVWEAAANTVGYDTNFIGLLDKERRYTGKLREWQQYQDWQKNRNPVRAAMEAEYGFDGKFGMHLIRLYRCCVELLRDGELNVRRPDAKELLEIRDGLWSFDRLMDESSKMDGELDALLRTTRLPKSPDTKAIDQLSVDLIQSLI